MGSEQPSVMSKGGDVGNQHGRAMALLFSFEVAERRLGYFLGKPFLGGATQIFGQMSNNGLRLKDRSCVLQALLPHGADDHLLVSRGGQNPDLAHVWRW